METEQTPTEVIKTPDSITFNQEGKRVLLNISKGDMDSGRVQGIAEKAGMTEKEEFHISVISFKNGNAIKSAVSQHTPEEQSILNEQIDNLVQRADWSFTPNNEFYAVTREYMPYPPDPTNPAPAEVRQTIMQTVDMPGIHEFYNQLNQLLNTSLEAPQPHVTLYVKWADKDKTDRGKLGIGLDTKTDFEKAEKIKLPVN